MKVRTSRLIKSLRPMLLAAPIWLACQGVAYAESWKVNLQEADIRAFINEVANITGKNFVLDPRINGNVTVISNRAMNEEQIYQLFLSVMQVNGVIAVNKNGIIELKPDNLAKQSGIPVDLAEELIGEQMVTRVIYLNHTQATEILSIIRPLLPQSAHAAAAPSVNALVLSDRAESLNQLTYLIRDLDSDFNDSVSVIQLRHTNAERIMEMISKLTGVATGNQASTGSQFNIIADNSSDRLIIKGSPEQIAKIQTIVNRLDTMPSKPLSSMQVFRLNYSDAAHVSNILRAMITGNSINSAESASTLTTASLAAATSNANSRQTSTASTAGNNAISSSGSGGNAILDTYGHPFSIIADETKNAIYVNASSQTMVDIKSFVKQIDKPDVQVLIQAAIIEVSGDDLQQLGVQWALGSPNKGYSLTNFSNAGQSVATLATSILSGSATAASSAATSIAGALLGLGNTRKNSNGDTEFYGAILQAIEKTTSANLLSSPSITTLNHKEANLLVGQNVPFVTGSYTTSASSNTNPFQTVERQDVGIQLNVKPHVGSDGMIKLEVSQEVSSVVESSTTNISGLTTNKSAINTTVMANNGETVALGGLMRERNTQSEEKVPGLGNIPLLGRLFRSDNESSQKSNLIIFLRPTVVRNGGVLPSITERQGDKIKTMQLMIDDNGTIKQVPLSGNKGWYAQEVKLNNTNNQELMSINPLSTSHNVNMPFIPSAASFPQKSGFTTVPSNNHSGSSINSTTQASQKTGINTQSITTDINPRLTDNPQPMLTVSPQTTNANTNTNINIEKFDPALNPSSKDANTYPVIPVIPVNNNNHNHSDEHNDKHTNYDGGDDSLKHSMENKIKDSDTESKNSATLSNTLDSIDDMDISINTELAKEMNDMEVNDTQHSQEVVVEELTTINPQFQSSSQSLSKTQSPTSVITPYNGINIRQFNFER